MVEEYRYTVLMERRRQAKLHDTNPTIGMPSSSDQQPRGPAEQRLEPSPPIEEVDELETISPIKPPPMWKTPAHSTKPKAAIWLKGPDGKIRLVGGPPPSDGVIKARADRQQTETEMRERTVRRPKSRALNALQHGAFAKATLLQGEDADELKDLRRRFKDDLRPHGETELRYFDVVVNWAWRMLRFLRWQNETRNHGESAYDIREEIEIPARLSNEYDKAVRRFFQCRASRKMLGFADDDGRPIDREQAKISLLAPSSDSQRQTSVAGSAADQRDDAVDCETTE